MTTGEPYILIEREATQSIPAGVNTAVVFDTVDEDRFSMWDQAHKSRLLIPNGFDVSPDANGPYFCWATVDFSKIAESTRRFVAFRVNGAGTLWWQDSRGAINDASEDTQVLMSGPIPMLSGQFLELIVRHDSISSPRDVIATCAVLGPIV